MEPMRSPYSTDSESRPIGSPFRKDDKPALPVLLGGLVTGVLALAVVWVIAGGTDFNLMGWYFWFVLPAGAIIVGAVAGSGYGVVSWITGTKISRGLLLGVVALQIACYFGAWIVEYRQVVAALELEDVSFFAYFDFTTRMFAFIGDDGEAGRAMGAWGYAFRLLELGGFIAGGLIAPMIMRSKAFCEPCQVYMKRKHVVLLPAGIVPRKVKKKDVEAQEALAADAEVAWI